MPSDAKEAKEERQRRKERIIGLGERSLRKSYYPQLRQNLDRLERFRTLLDHTSDFVILVALPDGTVTDANMALGKLLGTSSEALIGVPFSSLGLSEATDVLAELRLDMQHPEEVEQLPSHFVTLEFDRGEQPVWLELSYRVALVEQRCYGIMVGRDISARKEAEDKLRYLAYHDALTGLPNHLLFQDRLQQAVTFADRSGSKLALLVIDLDRFKAINDSLGHSLGNNLLIEVARRLGDCAEDIATVGRQGGDEYLVLLPNLPDLDTAVAFISQLMQSLQAPFLLEGKELSVSASIGIAMFPEDGREFESLLKNAEMAMYRAKDAGRNTYRFFNESMNVEASERLTLHFGLRRGIDQGEFVLYYQPQLEIASGALLGAEALIRWNHPEFGMVAPNRFIPVAEESGLIVPLGNWVLHEACRAAAQWQVEGGADLIVAVNLSTLQFKRGDIEQAVASALKESGLNPAQLELELTESILIRDTEKVLRTVKCLKLMGVKLSIDDFGTGYSSLSYLKRFEVDKLKIDQSFIRDLAANPDDSAIVRAIIQLAHSLGLRTIAEGVENRAVLDQLHRHDCDETQGYFHGRPMPAEAFSAFIRDHHPAHA